MEQGMVPNLAVAEFGGYQIAKQGDLALALKGQQSKLRVKLADTGELKMEVEAMDVELKIEAEASLVVYCLDSLVS